MKLALMIEAQSKKMCALQFQMEALQVERYESCWEHLQQ